MGKIRIQGGQIVNGIVPISGAKNAALPLLTASLLSSNSLSLTNVPPLLDISTMLELLGKLGISYEIEKKTYFSETIHLKTDSVSNFVAPYDIVKKMRASFLVLGPLLGRFGHCSVSLPGGCAIGVRPIDVHLQGLEALGATIELKDGYVHAKALRGLKGNIFKFPIVTVTGTENIIMAAVLADGETVLKNSAKEPEIADLCNCLNNMGAKISGIGTSELTITGVTSLHHTNHNVISDRIEAGTYAIAAAATQGNIDLIGENLSELLEGVLSIFSSTGMNISTIKNGIRINTIKRPKNLDIDTSPFPGFPTDLQAQLMSLLSMASGKSHIRENIWENRFMHVAELSRMGANISITGSQACIEGVDQLIGAQVMATDLRASFCLVIAGLVAKGETIIDRIYHLDRGYCGVKQKFENCGIKIERFEKDI